MTLFSMLPSVLASAVALSLLSEKNVTPSRMLAGGVLIGLGIGTMHYTGMAAMRVAATLAYDPVLFVLSVLVAVVLSVLALWIRFGLMRYWPSLSPTLALLAGGTVQGLAIAGMHYTGMAAAVFTGDPTRCSFIEGLSDSSFLAIAIGGVTMLITLLAMGFNIFMRQTDLVTRLRQQRQSQAAIVQTSVEGIILIDEQGTIQEFNPACETMFGYSRDEVIGRNIGLMIPSPHQRWHDGYIESYLQTGKRRVIGSIREVEGLRSDGTIFPVEVSVGEAVDDSGRVFVGVLRDISERKAMETSLRQAKETAEQALQVKSAFLANMSHEIRTPMNAVLGFLELALAERLDEPLKHHLETAHRSARTLLRLLNDILDSAKLEQGAVVFERQAFSLEAVLADLHSLFVSQASKKGIELKVARAPEVAACLIGDELRLRQILSNLLGNAVKFTASGQVDLSVDLDHNGLIRFRVQDTGIGIPADRLPHIFEPFVQSDASTTRRFGGTGLGTTIARQLAEGMGGRITAESTEGQGSCFTVLLPMEATACPERSIESALELPPGTLNLNVLVAEDVSANAELITLRLQGLGHRVTWAHNGLEAVQLAGEGQFDLLLMDVQMPEMDGLEAARRIRADEQREGRPHLPIIALTAGAFHEDREAVLAAGMDGFATKPLDFGQLCGEVRRVLNLDAAHGTSETTGTAANVHIRGIDIESALARWGDIEAYLQSLKTYAGSLYENCSQVRMALSEKQTDSALERLHGIKGAAATLAMTRVSRIVESLETVLRQPDRPEGHTEMLLSDLFTAVHELQVELANLPHSRKAQSTAKNPDWESAVLLLEVMYAGFTRGTWDEGKLAALAEAMGEMAEDASLMQLQAAVQEFDFDAAQRHAKILLEKGREALNHA
ncbi:MAG: PAS domain S-box protein [Thiobacillus sp.]|nr:PAS domain S-box protein [Thiobacillus sp.]